MPVILCLSGIPVLPYCGTLLIFTKYLPALRSVCTFFCLFEFFPANSPPLSSE